MPRSESKERTVIFFEEALCRQMRHALADVEGDFSVTREMGRIYVRTEGAFDYDGAVEALKRVFGIAGICPVVIVEDTGFEDLSKAVVEYVKEVYGDEEKTFKVCARRAKKTYPMSSMELNSELGGRILQACPNMKVDVHTPDVYLNVEIRQEYLSVLRDDSGARRNAGGNQRPGDAPALRRN